MSIRCFDKSISPILLDDNNNGILFLAGSCIADDLDELEKYNITHIVNVTDILPNTFEHFRNDANQLQFTYHKIPIPDSPLITITDYFPAAFEFIHTALSTGKHVLVHCFAGKSRSASVVIGYLIKHCNMRFEEAYTHVKHIRPSIDPNIGFYCQLQEEF
jgi:protein-tyrosine phosphatase